MIGMGGLLEQGTYRIGEVAEMLNLRSHVLRFWETEFPQLEPLRTETGQRVYTEEHVGLLRRIQQLLHEQGMTIEGARRVLAGAPMPDEDDSGCGPRDLELMEMIQSEIAAVCALLRQEGR